MTFICNDQLTRVREPSWGKDFPVPRIYQIGQIGKKNDAEYTIRAFGACAIHIPGLPDISDKHPRMVWMYVKFKGIREWIPLLIGDTSCFQEKLVFGKHRNIVFNR